MKKAKISGFVGRQLSRLKMGLIYYTMAMSTFMALGILNIAFPEINFWVLVLLFPIVLIGVLLFGYIMDITNVAVTDHQKTLDMTHRYLNIADYKINEFYMATMKTMGQWLKAFQENKPIDLDILDVEYKKFKEGWSPKEGKQ